MPQEYELKFNGNTIRRTAEVKVANAIGQACDYLVREVKDALSKTGPNQSLQKAFGISKKNGPHDRARGEAGIKGLQELRIGKHRISHGGTFTDKDGANHDGMYWYGEPLNKWAQASPVGSPPHKQLGNLRDSIDREHITGQMTGKVGPTDELVYARRQELGGPGRYPARPYLRPTFLKNRAKIEAMLTKAARSVVK